MVKLDKMTGKTVWAAKELERHGGLLVIVAADVEGVRTNMTFTEAAGVGVRASDGKLMFRYPNAEQRRQHRDDRYADNKVFFASGYGRGRPAGPDRQEWRVAARRSISRAT